MADFDRTHQPSAPIDLDVGFEDQGDGTVAPIVSVRGDAADPVPVAPGDGPGTVTQAAVAATTTSAQLVAANTSRKVLIIENTANKAAYILLGAGTAAPTDFSFSLGSGDKIVLDSNCPTSEAQVVLKQGTGDVMVTEVE